MARPTTSGQGARPFTAQNTSTQLTPTEEDDEDPGMFTFLPPANHIVPASAVSPAAAYAAHFIRHDAELAQSLARSRNAQGLHYDDTGEYVEAPFGLLPAKQAIDGYSVNNVRAPVIALASRLERAAQHSGHRASSTNSLDMMGDPQSPTKLSHSDSILQAPAPTLSDLDRLAYAPRTPGEDDPFEAYAQKVSRLDSFNGMQATELLSDLPIGEEDSPFPEVRASVSNIDDPEMPCLTFRSWFIGLTMTAVCAALNFFFLLRYPSPYLTPILIQIIAYPIGKLFASVLPMTTFSTPKVFRWAFGCDPEWSLNPGPFNIKEHTVIIIMANAALAPAYALNMTLVFDKYYNISKGVGFDLLIVLSSQMVGFGFAGLCRRFLVWPAGLVWPNNLVICTLLNTFHAEDDDGRDGSITRFKFFSFATAAAFAWYFLPNFLFQALSFFSWICWIWPDNIIVNQLFGVYTGLGMGMFTFDWGQISYIGSPLITPWWAIANTFAGFLFFYWFLTPILYYKNMWNFAHMPMFSTDVFDRHGQVYNVSSVVTSDHQFDAAAYSAYSPVYMPVTYVAVYCIAFALATAIIVHTALYHGKSICQKFMRIKNEVEDVHLKLMRNYPEVPDWWYGIYTVAMVVLAIIAIEVWDTEMPIWALLIALLVALVYILPGGFIMAMTSQQITLNLLAELIPGYLFPGKAVAVMIFKSFCVQSLGSGLTFTQDLKLGHYMKLPPRVTFTIQIVCSVVSCLAQIGTKYWLEHSVPDLCDPAQANKAFLVCPSGSVFYSSSVIWGVIGPRLSFNSGMLYRPMLWFTLIGAVLPIPLWLITKKWPKSWVRYINVPVILTGVSFIPPATGINYVSWFIVGFIFQYWMRRHRFRWWSKFNFVLSAALEGGTLLSGIFIFVTLQLPKHGRLAVQWWGNTVFTETTDWSNPPYLTPPAEGFGPSTWPS